MSKPIHHAINSVTKFGSGSPDDYEPIHSLMDSSKAAYAKMGHRIVFHHKYGHRLISDILSRDKRYPGFWSGAMTRGTAAPVNIERVCDQHTEEDLGFIPTLADWDKAFKPTARWVGKSSWTAEHHAMASVNKHGGDEKDYLRIHKKINEPKGPTGRLIFHSAFGAFIIEALFGIYILNSEGKVVSTRQIAEDHILRVFRRIPSLGEWMKDIQQETWMAGSRKAKYDIVD